MLLYTAPSSARIDNDAVNGIPPVDPCARRGAAKRAVQWLASTRFGVKMTHSLGVPLDAALLKATGGRPV